MSIKKLNDYLKKPDPPIKGGKTLTPVLFSDSKGNYLERQIRPGISREIKFWSEKGRTTKKGVQWLRDNIDTKIGQLDNISIYVWLGEKLEQLLLRLINLVFKHGCIPDILKKGLLTPVFKNKGDRCHAANYIGITVLPVVNKIIEAIIRDRIQPRVLQDQNPTQRGFTAKSSPLNAALVVEEVYRESVDSNQEFELVLLDAKSAFDVVVHSHLMRRLFHCGIDDTLWRIIQSMHWQSTSAIKWERIIADEFSVSQGVRQGGILSTDLYKVYVNPLLNRLQQSGLG
ncbi:unnamed protein product [Mytilus coruscus]|uniref:Reverse transcriptase domain-containing protein n=1 Tax=Mytilus coruscus TaxID=42192 RepID=A0A6J8E9X7_MYTCO|nr:unnamed protein product [Mytilus coruscus]